MTIVWEVLIGALYLAIVFAVVRPGSPAASAVSQISNALVGVVQTVTGYQGG